MGCWGWQGEKWFFGGNFTCLDWGWEVAGGALKGFQTVSLRSLPVARLAAGTLAFHGLIRPREREWSAGVHAEATEAALGWRGASGRPLVRRAHEEEKGKKRRGKKRGRWLAWCQRLAGRGGSDTVAVGEPGAMGTPPSLRRESGCLSEATSSSRARLAGRSRGAVDSSG